MTKVTMTKQTMKTLKDVAKIVKGKMSAPIFDYMLFEVNDDSTVHVTVCNGDLFVKKTLSCYETIVDDLSKRFIVPLKTIKGMKLGRDKSALFSFESNGDNHEIKTKAGGVTAKVYSSDPEEYPKTIASKKEKFIPVSAIRADSLKKLKAATLSVSSSETRPVLTTIVLRENNIISTDSHRLFHSTYEGKFPEQEEVLLSSEAISAITSIEPEKNFFAVVRRGDHGTILIETMTGHYYFVERQGKYPDVSRLVPNEFSTVVEITDVEKLTEIATACTALGNEKNVMKVDFNGVTSAQISSSSPDMGTIEESLAVKLLKGDGNLILSFNSQYLLDGLKQIDTSNGVTLSFINAMRPFIVEGKVKETFSLILPVRTY